MDEPLAQRILDIIYQDPVCRHLYKESLTDWILDTQPRTAPFGSSRFNVSSFQQELDGQHQLGRSQM